MRVLISISETKGIVSFLKNLMGFYTEIEIIATSGTYKYLKNNDIHSTEISDYIDFPEILDGRVKSLHPKIFGGILSSENLKSHNNELKKYNINYLIAKDTNFNEDKNIILVYKNNKFSIYRINE